ncbi:MAG: DNA-3-methyladenine glycosylase [Planctomycetota bacterium]
MSRRSRPRQSLPPLPESSYRPSVLDVARALVGQLIVREYQGERLVGRIVETEAYAGLVDPASHSYRGMTPRCRTMFGPAGRAYVYFSYGNHYCLNVIAGPRELAGAVLLRGVEGVEGIETMRRLRAARPGKVREKLLAAANDEEIASGPGKLTVALAVDLGWDGHDLTLGEGLWLAHGRRAPDVVWTPRVGLGKNPAASWLWRCADVHSRATTRIPRGWPCEWNPRPASVEELLEGGSLADHRKP